MSSLKIYIAGDAKKFDATLNRVNRRLSRWHRNVMAKARYGALAMAGASAYAVRAAMQQEEAERGLEAALLAHGDAAGRAMPSLLRLSSAIQRQTVIGDEASLALMTQLRNLGVMPDRMEEATKGAIGLARALGIDQSAAAKMSALALAGNYDLLTRYVPALRTTTDATERQAIVSRLMAAGWEQERAAAKTSTGQLKQLRNALGDAAEAYGAVGLSALRMATDSGRGTDAVLGHANSVLGVADEIGFAIADVFDRRVSQMMIGFGFAADIARGWFQVVRDGFHNIGEVARVTWTYGVDLARWFANSTMKAFAAVSQNAADMYAAITDAAYMSAMAALKPFDSEFREAAQNSFENVREIAGRMAGGMREAFADAPVLGEIDARGGIFGMFAALGPAIDAVEKRTADMNARSIAREEALRLKSEERIARWRAGRMADDVVEVERDAADAVLGAGGVFGRQAASDWSDQFRRVGAYMDGGRGVDRGLTLNERQVALQTRMAQALEAMLRMAGAGVRRFE